MNSSNDLIPILVLLNVQITIIAYLKESKVQKRHSESICVRKKGIYVTYSSAMCSSFAALASVVMREWRIPDAFP